MNSILKGKAVQVEVSRNVGNYHFRCVTSQKSDDLFTPRR